MVDQKAVDMSASDQSIVAIDTQLPSLFATNGWVTRLHIERFFERIVELPEKATQKQPSLHHEPSSLNPAIKAQSNTALGIDGQNNVLLKGSCNSTLL